MEDCLLSTPSLPNRQETLFVLMNCAGDYLCKPYLQKREFVWNGQIGRALQGRDEAQLCRQLTLLQDRMEERGRKATISQAWICRADIWSGTGDAGRDILQDFICRMDGDAELYRGFSTLGRPTPFLAKEIGRAHV